jgi:hypothetical protein
VIVNQTVGYGGPQWFVSQLNQFTKAALSNDPDNNRKLVR